MNFRFINKWQCAIFFLLISLSCSKIENQDIVSKRENLNQDLNTVKIELSNFLSVLTNVTKKNKRLIIENEDVIKTQFNGDVILFLNKSEAELTELNNSINHINHIISKNKILVSRLNNSEFKEKLIDEILVK